MRIMQSRNKREGGYVGNRESRHTRKGKSSKRTLKDGVCHFYRDYTSNYLPPELQSVIVDMPMWSGMWSQSEPYVD